MSEIAFEKGTTVGLSIDELGCWEFEIVLEGSEGKVEMNGSSGVIRL